MGHQIQISEKELARILHLLATTDSTIKRIAESLGRTPGAIRKINDEHHIRIYTGLKRWTVAGRVVDTTSIPL
jgi:predicted transcriptional regulator